MNKLYCLLDCNNFYVSCERLYNPKLKNKPVVVLSHENGCIIACSNSVKRKKITIGSPLFMVRKELEGMQCKILTGRLELYKRISQRVMSSLKLLTQDIEVYSIDEAFFQIPDTIDAKEYCNNIKVKIEQWTDIPVSIGVSHTKTLAKIANKYAKKMQETKIMISCWEIQESLQKTPVEDIWGIGKKNSFKFSRLNIHFAIDLLMLETNFIKKNFGTEVLKTIRELEGINTIEIKKHIQKKNISSSKILTPKSNNTMIIKGEIARHIGIICQKSIKQNSEITQVSIKVYYIESNHEIHIRYSANNEASIWLNLINKKLKQNHELCRRIKVSAYVNPIRQNTFETHHKISSIIINMQKKLGKNIIFLASGAHKLTRKT